MKISSDIGTLIHSVIISEIFPHLKIFSSNWLTGQFFCEKVNLTECLQKNVGEKLSNYHTVQYTVWKLQKFSLTLFLQKFRESNGFTKEITKLLIWRNFFQWDRISSFSILCTKRSEAYHFYTLWFHEFFAYLVSETILLKEGNWIHNSSQETT